MYLFNDFKNSYESVKGMYSSKIEKSVVQAAMNVIYHGNLD